MRNKKLSKNEKEHRSVKSLSWRQVSIALFFGLIIYFVYHASIRTIENFLLSRHGRTVKAVVIERKNVGGGAAVSLTYKFAVGGMEYVSEQSNEPYQVGDTVDILYLDINPRITRTYRFIKNNYDTKIELKHLESFD
jgi:hypothetical protein